MRAVIWQHEDDEGPGRLEAPLRAAGFALVRRFRAPHREDLDAELLVVLGGAMRLADEAAHPFLGDERALLLERLALERPCLAVGLGAQLLASAAGADVFEGKNGLELGASPVRWTKDALADPVLAGVGARTAVAHWHHDTHGPVPDAALLASSDRYTQQAFRLGASYAFQFHLELDAAGLERLVDARAEALAALGKDAAAVRATAGKLRGAAAELDALAERLAHHFAARARG